LHFSISRCVQSQRISLCGYLEAIIGKYYLYQVGNPCECWYAIYYDASMDKYNECVEIIDKNLMGYRMGGMNETFKKEDV